MSSMRMLRSALLLCALPLAGVAQAEDGLRLAARAGTLGLGLEGTWQALPWLDVRAGINAFDYDDAGSRAGVNYDATLELRSAYATANFRLPDRPFRLSAGLFANGNELALTSRESGTVRLGGTLFLAEDIGTLRGATSFDDVAPYLGFGLDFGLPGRWGMSIDLGVLFQGSARVSLRADGPLAGNPVFESALAAEREELADDLEDLEAYPVIALGLSYGF